MSQDIKIRGLALTWWFSPSIHLAKRAAERWRLEFDKPTVGSLGKNLVFTYEQEFEQAAQMQNTVFPQAQRADNIYL